MRHSSIQLEVNLRSKLADLILIMGFQTSLFKEITNFKTDYPDESGIELHTWSFNPKSVDLETLGYEIITSVTHDDDIIIEFQENNHITFWNNNETLTIHYNDSTVTAIYHNNGEF